ncbi:hypothetical protein ACFL2Z_04860 [Candidatus Eisenbacteria bacterium]|uniref:Uncharacterized protein n=1 Tax=Eiseniibacteriota bacterium TaxID=2212470 RepID=A0ABV6YQ72_UNCEI
MEKHITLAGAFNLAMGIMGILGVITASLMMATLEKYIEEPDAAAIAILAVSLGISYLAVISTAQIICAIGLLKRRPWSRVLMIIVSAVKLLSIPIGTALGIYTIWVLIQDETKTILNAGSNIPST